MESEVKAEPVGGSSEPTDAATKEVRQPPLPTSASSQVIAPSSSLPGALPPNITTTFREMLPKQGYLHCEDELTFVLCKPKLLPLKSFTMEKLEKIQAETVEKAKELMENSQLD